MMTPLVVPTINLNGNTAVDLVEKLKDLMTKLRETSAAFADACDVTHGRNFQTLVDGDRVRIEADHAWRERWMMIDKIRQDIENLAISIQRQDRRSK